MRRKIILCILHLILIGSLIPLILFALKNLERNEIYETIGAEYMITINGITLPLNTVLKLRQKDNEIILIIPHYVPDGADSEQAVANYWANKGSFRVVKSEIIED